MLFEKISENKVEELSKKIETFFAYNKDIDKTAYMNWRLSFDRSFASQFSTLADGFFESSIKMIDICLEDNSDKKADSWIFPILFNIVHGIELYLKSINLDMNVILEQDVKIEGGHRIKQLCDVAQKRLMEIKQKVEIDGVQEMITALKVVKNFVEIIYEKTDDMAFARYPITKDKQAMFYVATRENVVIDLEKLREQLRYVCCMLNFISDCLGRYHEYLSEMKSYYTIKE